MRPWIWLTRGASQRILWYAVGGVLLYPIGIPLYMWCTMVYHGVRRIAKEKQAHARFQVRSPIPTRVLRRSAGCAGH